MTELDKTGLEPCPFCGGEASLRDGGPGCFFVQCDMCNATSDDRSQDTAIKAWNSRATTSAGVTEEQVEAACAKYAWARYGGTVVWPRDFSPKEISEGRENMRLALEASRVDAKGAKA